MYSPSTEERCAVACKGIVVVCGVVIVVGGGTAVAFGTVVNVGAVTITGATTAAVDFTSTSTAGGQSADIGRCRGC